MNRKVRSSSLHLFADSIYLSDVFFSIWLNDIPSQLHVIIRRLPGSHAGASFALSKNFRHHQHRNSILAIRILENYLRWNKSNNTNHLGFSRQQNRRFPHCVKSPSPNDEFIFVTNILPIDIHQIPFNISKDFERGTRKNLPQESRVSLFKSHTTIKAVDNNSQTCWRSGRNARHGEFFAIDFLQIRTNLSFTLTIQHSQELQNSLDMNLSLDGFCWATYRSMKGVTMKRLPSTLNQQQFTILFNSSEFHSGFQSFRYFAFNASRKSYSDEFQVCEVQIVTSVTVH